MEEIKKYVEAFEEIEERIVDDDKFPIVKDSKIKKCCEMTLEIIKIFYNNIRFYIDATEDKKQIER